MQSIGEIAQRTSGWPQGGGRHGTTAGSLLPAEGLELQGCPALWAVLLPPVVMMRGSLLRYRCINNPKNDLRGLAERSSVHRPLVSTFITSITGTAENTGVYKMATSSSLLSGIFFSPLGCFWSFVLKFWSYSFKKFCKGYYKWTHKVIFVLHSTRNGQYTAIIWNYFYLLKYSCSTTQHYNENCCSGSISQIYAWVRKWQQALQEEEIPY